MQHEVADIGQAATHLVTVIPGVRKCVLLSHVPEVSVIVMDIEICKVPKAHK